MECLNLAGKLKHAQSGLKLNAIWRLWKRCSVFLTISKYPNHKMESTIDGPPDGGGTLAVNNFSQSTPWTSSQTATSTSENSTFLFIAVSPVEYVKDTNEYKFAPEVGYSPQGTPPCTNFEQHVSPLDPNMSSAARYSPSSPSCADADITYSNPVVVQQLISATSSQPLINTTRESFVDNISGADSALEGIPTSLSTADANLLKQVVTNRYLLNQQNSPAAVSPSGVLQLVPDPDGEQEVELLITDQATGISYNVSTQEYLVERCLSDEQQLLDALTPGPLLDSDLLALDDSTLKSQLPDIVDSVNSSTPLDNQSLVPSNSIVNTSAACPNVTQILIKTEQLEDDSEGIYNQENLRRSQRQVGLRSPQSEEQLLTQVHAISDKPVESRARATLPAAYLAIIKQSEEECGVFARKMIPKRTQFGPLEGLLVNNCKVEDDGLHLLLECEGGAVHCLDVSDENVANWMRFVRKANAYSEQNLLLSQQGNSLYYTTTTNIWPKQELLVGYSAAYAKKYDLPFLQPLPQKETDWPCFECDKHFATSDELQNHLNVHDIVKKESVKVKKKVFKSKRKKLRKKFQRHILECKICKATFSHPEYNILRRHLMLHGISSCVSFEEKFTIVNYNCEKCDSTFESEALMKIHSLRHMVNMDEMLISLICPDCQGEFATQEQLIEHVSHHRSDKSTSETKEGYKCPVCYKMFASLDRIQRHMLVHGSEESKPLKCDTCNKRFLNNSALACHLKTHSTDKKVFECPMCKESFDHVLQLKVHVPQHCVDGNYTCPHCKKIFKEYSIIRKHIRAFHCDRKHNCPHCDKPFPTLDKLRMHLLRHSDHREFLCADCGKQFKRKDKLKEHTKRMHSEERENTVPKPAKVSMQNSKKFTPKVQPTDYHRFIYKCHSCLVGFKRRGMLVNHLAKRHPDISPDSVPELNLPILRTTRDYYCQYCEKVYKSSSKRKAHILKNHPGQALPMSNRRQGAFPEVAGLPNPTFSQTVGSITTHPQACQWCHKQYASKAKLLQHQRKKHLDLLQGHSNQIKNSVHQNQAAPQRQDVEEIMIDTHSFKRDFKVSDEELLSEVVALNDDREDEQYYHIISVPPTDPLSFNHTAEIGHTSDSRLYRLLTTGNGLLPPR